MNDYSGLSKRGSALRKGAAVVAVGILFALAGCSANESEADAVLSTGEGAPVALDDEQWNELVETANAEGELVIYSGQPASEQVFAQFTEMYPEIEVTTVREPAGDLAIRMDQEIAANAPGADISWSTQFAWAEQHAESGALAAFQFNPDVEGAGWSCVTHEDYFLPLLAFPKILAWNTELAEPVTGIQDLIEKAQGKPVGLAEPTSQNGMAQLDAWIEAYGEEILDDIAALNPQIIRSTVPLSQSLAAGETVYSLVTSPDSVEELIAQGAPIDYVVEDENATGIAYGPMVLGNAPHPAAAQVFLNWVLSEEGQLALSEGFTFATFPLLYDNTTVPYDWDQIAIVDEREWPEERRNEFRAMFDSYFAN